MVTFVSILSTACGDQSNTVFLLPQTHVYHYIEHMVKFNVRHEQNTFTR